MKNLCNTYKFSTSISGCRVICNYMDLFGHSRGCKPENCAKYEKGKRIRTPSNENDLLKLRKRLREQYEVSA